jgi:hypothetical protein
MKSAKIFLLTRERVMAGQCAGIKKLARWGRELFTKTVAHIQANSKEAVGTSSPPV